MSNCISNTSYFFREADKVCDYIPFLSTISNLIDLFQKIIIIPLIYIMNKDYIKNDRYYKHLDEKNFSRCLFLLVPVIGNVCYGVIDMFRCAMGGSYPDDDF